MQVEYEALLSQINPHFLYNTLDTIVWLAEAGQKEQVVSMVQTLSDFFRASLNSGKDIVSLEGECRHITSYLQIQQVRYQDILTYDVDIPEEIANCKIPKITLQPLVENAIIHGLSSSSKGGLIYVRCCKKEDKRGLSVADTGIGIERDKLKNIRRYIDNIFLSPDTKPAATAENDNKSDADNGIKRKTVGVGIGNIAYRIKGMYNNSGIKIIV